MPKQLRGKKGDKKKSHSTIRIAKPEMNLEGFSHSNANLRKK